MASTTTETGFPHNPGMATSTAMGAAPISRSRSSKKATIAGQTSDESIANKMVDEFKKGGEYSLFSPYESEKSNWEVVFLPLSVNVDDIKTWAFLYGLPLAIVLAAFGSKSVWQMQAELLGRPSPSGAGGSDPGGPGDPAGSGAPCCPGEIIDQAAEDYKKTLEAESGRIAISGTIITQIATIALTLPSLSQTHSVARASWMFSLISSLLAVYYANNQAWKAGYLLLGNRLRKWIRGSSRSRSLNDYIVWARDRDDHIVQPQAGVRDQNLPELLVKVWVPDSDSDDLLFHNVRKETLPELLVRSLVPAPSSVLAVSAPGLLLAASLCFLLIGFGIYLGFIWTRKLDNLAGPHDSRDVFVIYLVSLLLCYCLFTASNTAHYQQATDSVRGTIRDSLGNLDTRLRMSERRYTQQRKAIDERQKLMLEQLHLSRRILNQLETQTLLSVENIDHSLKDTVDNGRFLLWGAERGDDGVVQTLLSRPNININQSDDRKRTALFWAAKNGHFAVVEELVGKGADVSVRDSKGETALFWAVKNGDMAIVQALIEQGADVSSTGIEEQPTLIEALIWAVRESDSAAVEELIEQGAISTRDSKGQTALFWAVRMRDVALVRELIARAADVSLVDSAGQTALFLAVKNGDMAIVEELIANGADVLLKDSKRHTALDLARAIDDQNMVSLLEEAKRKLGY